MDGLSSHEVAERQMQYGPNALPVLRYRSLKNDLRVIVDGIRMGRETHANTLKYTRATLVSDFGNFYAVAIGSLFISFLPI